MCKAKGLADEFFDDCVLDIVVTGDSSFADQTAFDLGNAALGQAASSSF